MAPPPAQPAPPDDGLVDKGRLASFSDNVISIALTLLVLDVRVPSDLGHLTLPALAHLLGPRLLAFALSFTIVGVYWGGHHLLLRPVAPAVPRSTLWANNLFLVWVTLIPAAAALMGQYPGQPLAAVLYGVNAGAAGASLVLLHHTAVRFHRRAGLPIPAGSVHHGYVRPALGVAATAVGVALAGVSPYLSYAVYGLSPLAFVVLQVLPAEPALPRPRFKPRRRPADDDSEAE